MVERFCAQHCVPLIELRCAYEHDADAWMVVRDGVALAYCTQERIVWRDCAIDLPCLIFGRNPDGTGGTPWGLDMQEERAADRDYRRSEENRRARRMRNRRISSEGAGA